MLPTYQTPLAESWDIPSGKKSACSRVAATLLFDQGSAFAASRRITGRSTGASLTLTKSESAATSSEKPRSATWVRALTVWAVSESLAESEA